MVQIKVTSTQIVLTSVEGSWIFFFSSKGSFFFSTWSEVNYDSPPAFRNEEASKSLQKKSSCL